MCVVDAAGKIVREAKVASELEALVAFLRGLEAAVTRIGLEAGPLSHACPPQDIGACAMAGHHEAPQIPKKQF